MQTGTDRIEKTCKSPGSDGLTPEFYKCFWQEIKDLVVDSLNFANANNGLSIDQRRGIITLLPKPEKDKLLLKNWRPISLLNTDYKIAAKCIATRLKIHLPKLINPDQTGYVKNRFIGQNIRLITDIIHLTRAKHLPAIILLIDFEKAFDSVDWSYMEKVLETFNFGPSFVNWIKTFYNDITSCLINN